MSTHGSILSNQREVLPCICGCVLVVVESLRAACVLRLRAGFSVAVKMFQLL